MDNSPVSPWMIIWFLLPFVFMPIGMVVIFIIVVHKRRESRLKAFEKWVLANNFTLSIQSALPSSSTFAEGLIDRGFQSVLSRTSNQCSVLWQIETRGSGKNRRVYRRTIVVVDIPDTQLQLIINSKLNNDMMSGGNIARYTKNQRFSLEGDFGEFFDVFMPETTQSESLSMLSPDSMFYIMVNLIDYDIEINGNKLYLYRYKHLSENEALDVMHKVEGLLEEMRLRKDDVRKEAITNALVARTAADSSTVHRKLKKDFQWLGILAFLAYITFRLFSGTIIVIIPVLIFTFMFLKFITDAVTELRLRFKYKQVMAKYKKI